MRIPSSRWAVVLLGTFLAGAVLADGSEAQPQRSRADSDYEQGKKAIEAKQWNDAVRLLERVESRQQSNPDVANLLGFAERNRGNMDAAFAHYEKALRLDPGHRGAHEYVGEAYLMVGNVPKAEEHLAQLARLCNSSCEEFSDLQKSIQGYKSSHGG
jgi:Flp pilus assembly protein TadD